MAFLHRDGQISQSFNFGAIDISHEEYIGKVEPVLVRKARRAHGSNMRPTSEKIHFRSLV